VAIVILAVLVSLLMRTFVLQTFFIPSASMEPTLQLGDRVMVSKLSLDFGSIHRGDILVFKAPPAASVCGADDPKDFVKRVIGLPGDHLTSKGNTIYVNGQALNITCNSYAGKVCFGFTGCRDTVPHLQRLAVYCAEALAEYER